MRPVVSLAFAGLALASCAPAEPPDAAAPATMSFVAETRPAATLPDARWDHKPQAEQWTEAALTALKGHGAPLVSMVPEDADTWCPAYADATAEDRKAFWVGLLSALAKHESTWRPHVSGGDHQWHGLLQISPATARGYGCAADSAEELKNGEANLKCGLRIMAYTVPRDGVIAADGGGVAADWAPFHNAEKRADMVSWTRAQDYCRPS